MTLLERRSLQLGAALALTLAVASLRPSPNAADVAAGEILARIESGTAPVLLDVRTPEEFASGHVPGALNIPHDELAQRLGEIEGRQSSEVVVYCERGPRAARAANILAGAGFREVRHLEGDMSAWRAAGRPTE
jgi:rhodanese-related sulfurtransferase